MMVSLFQKAGFKWTFGSTLKAVRRNSKPVQISIALFVQSSLQQINYSVDGKTLIESSEILQRELRSATQLRQQINATGNSDEGNPTYARVALLESALISICSGDEGLANFAFRELHSWYAELGLPTNNR